MNLPENLPGNLKRPDDGFSMLDRVQACVYVKDHSGRYLYVNAALCALYGVSAQDMLGARDEQFIDPDLSSRLRINDELVLQTGESIYDEEDLVLRGNSEHHKYWTAKAPLLDDDGQVTAICGFSIKIDQLHSTAEYLIRRNQLLSTLMDNIDIYIYLKDADGRYLYANQKLLTLYGCQLDDILGCDDTKVHPPEVARALMAIDHQVLEAGSRLALRETLLDGEGKEHYYWSIKLPLALPGAPSCLLGFSTEITELLFLREDLERQRITDALTGLSNQVQFKEDLARELDKAVARHQPLAVLYMDLDHFKYINTHLGPETGNQLLREVALRLRVTLPRSSSVARIDGDSFAATLPQGEGGDADQLTKMLHSALAEPFILQGKRMRITVSIGLAMFPLDGSNATALLTHAEAAMYQAKARGRDQSQSYTPELSVAVATRVDLESDLRAALASGQFELHYQPKVHAGDASISGFEALLRWRRPGHGLVAPLEFIPLAEQLGLLVSIGAWVVADACRQMAEWRNQGLGRVSVAVNVSPSQLRSANLTEEVRSSLERYDIRPGELEMEVTESMMMDEPRQAITILEELHALGVRLSIDDFGTGYSSMAYLKVLPVHTLKLDRTFVKEVDVDPRDADLCAGIIAMAHKLGLKVVAEGVETRAQSQILYAHECDVFQGYLYSRPLPVAEATAYLRNESAKTPAA